MNARSASRRCTHDCLAVVTLPACVHPARRPAGACETYPRRPAASWHLPCNPTDALRACACVPVCAAFHAVCGAIPPTLTPRVRVRACAQVTLGGTRYLFSGKELPELRKWLEQNVGVDINDKTESQPAPRKPAPSVRNDRFIEAITRPAQQFVRLSFDDEDRVFHGHGHTAQVGGCTRAHAGPDRAAACAISACIDLPYCLSCTRANCDRPHTPPLACLWYCAVFVAAHAMRRRALGMPCAPPSV
jgi:hypothetical protein